MCNTHFIQKRTEDENGPIGLSRVMDDSLVLILPKWHGQIYVHPCTVQIGERLSTGTLYVQSTSYYYYVLPNLVGLRHHYVRRRRSVGEFYFKHFESAVKREINFVL